MIRVKRIHTFLELDEIEKSWNNLEQVDDGPSIFQSWIWNRTWCKYVLPGLKHARLDVRLLEDGSGRLLAILPFFEKKVAGPVARLTQFLGHRMSYHNDILLAEPKNSELAKEVVRVLISDIGFRTVLHLRHLDGESLFTKQLLSKRLAEAQCNRVWVHDDPRFTDHRERLGKSKKKTLRWAGNYLRKHFNSKFCIIAGVDFPKAFEELIDLHQRRFDSIERSTLLEGTSLAFLKAATSKLSNLGNFEITQLIAGGVTIAAMLMARDKNRYFFIQSGFNPEFNRYSPMRLLITETMRHGFDDLGCKYFDFGAGYESYKYDWKPSVGTNYFCCIGGQGPYAKLLAALYRFTFRRKLPSAPKVKI